MGCLVILRCSPVCFSPSTCRSAGFRQLLKKKKTKRSQHHLRNHRRNEELLLYFLFYFSLAHKREDLGAPAVLLRSLAMFGWRHFSFSRPLFFRSESHALFCLFLSNALQTSSHTGHSSLFRVSISLSSCRTRRIAIRTASRSASHRAARTQAGGQ